MPSSAATLRRITVLSGGVGGARFLQGLLHGLRTGVSAGRVRRHRGHRGRQHRRRLVDPRPQGLPRPRHRDVHPRRRHRRRARVGPPRRDVERQDGARGVRRRADVVRPRATATSRPTWSAPRCSRPATRCRRSPRRCAAAGTRSRRRPAAADDATTASRPTSRSPTPTARAGAGSSTSRSTGCGCAPRCRPRRCSSVGQDAATPAPGVLEAIGEADLVVLPPSNPVVSVGTILGVPGIRDAVRATAAPVVGLSPIVGASHVHGMAAPDAHQHRCRGQRRRRRRALRRPVARRACSTAGWSTSRDADQLAGLEEAGDPRRGRAADDDRPRRDRGDGRRRRRRSSPPDRHEQPARGLGARRDARGRRGRRPRGPGARLPSGRRRRPRRRRRRCA